MLVEIINAARLLSTTTARIIISISQGLRSGVLRSGQFVLSGFNQIGALFFNAAKILGRIGYENLTSAIYQSTQQTMPANWMNHPDHAPKTTWGRRIADLALFLFTTLPGWLLGLTLIPLAVHSFKSFGSFFKTPTKLLYADKEANDLVPTLHGRLYGLPGAALGFVSGTPVALFWLGARILEQTWDTTAAFWIDVVNWSVQDVEKGQEILPKIKLREYKSSVTSFAEIKNPTRFEKFIGIFPLGWATSLISGAITLSIIAAGRLILNTLVSTWRNFSRGLNWSVSDMYEGPFSNQPPQIISLEEKDNRNLMIQRGLFGFVGEVLGVGLGIAGFVVSVSARIVINSAESFGRVLFKSIHLSLKTDSSLGRFFKLSEDRRENPKNGWKNTYGYSLQLGYPGFYGLGLVAVGVGVPTGAILRVMHETAISAAKTAIESLNLALNGVPDYQPIAPLETTRKPHERVLGMLGYPLGAGLLLPVTGSILLGRYVITNFDTATKVARFFIRAGRSGDVHRGRSGKNISNQERTFASFGVGGNNSTVYDSDEEEEEEEDNSNHHYLNPTDDPYVQPEANLLDRLENWIEGFFDHDERPYYVQIASFPGALVGAALGGGWRVLTETTLASIDSAARALEFAVYGSPFQKKFFTPLKPKRNRLETVLGGPGYVIGFAIALAPVALIGLVRWVITNGDTANRSYIATLNLMRLKRLQLTEPNKDQRPPLIRYSTFLGAGLGILLGLSREIGGQIIESFRRQAYDLTRKALFESDFEQKFPDLSLDARGPLHQFLGYPGLALGLLAGGIAFTSITLVRVGGNTLITAYHTVRDMVDFVFLDDYPDLNTLTEVRRLTAFFQGWGADYQHREVVTIELNPIDSNTAQPTRKDPRPDYPFRLGLPGFVIGGPIGLASALVAGLGRIAWNSILTTRDTTLAYADSILPEGLNTESLRIAERKPIPKLLGYPLGNLFGSVLGAVAWVGILTARFVYNTALSTWFVAGVVATLPPISEAIADLNDPRAWSSFDRRIGVLGYPLGVPFGIAGFVLNYTYLTVYHSLISMQRNTAYIIGWAIGSPENNPQGRLLLGVEQDALLEDSRTPFERYGFGVLGFIGVVPGIVVASVISLARLIQLNDRLLGIGFKRAANLTLETSYPENSMRLDHTKNTIQFFGEITLTNQQLAAIKYVFGGVGFVIGVSSGLIFAALPVGCMRWAKASAQSYYHLSQSLLNVGLEASYFNQGVGADERPAKIKALGGLGYLAAVVTTGTIPVISLLSKGILVTLALGFSPLVAVIKLAYIQLRPRFKARKNDDVTPARETKMRQLYSALVNGEFPANSGKPSNSSLTFSPEATGGKGVSDFFRKAALFNMNSLTEDILQAKWDALRKSQNNSFDLSQEAIDEIKKNHRPFFFFTTPMRKQDERVLNVNFQNIETFVNGHLNQDALTNWPEKVGPEASFAELFFAN